MALIYRAQLKPSKIELLREWVPRQPWIGSADVSTLDHLGAYRFDDPDGEVGIETHLLRTCDGAVLQVPLTYRGVPLAGAESFLIATMDHSILGSRWVYDACCDPVFVRALTTTIVTGGVEATLQFSNSADAREVTTHVSGSGKLGTRVPEVGAVTCSPAGSDTRITSTGLDVTLVRVIDVDRASDAAALTGTWPGQSVSALLAVCLSSSPTRK